MSNTLTVRCSKLHQDVPGWISHSGIDCNSWCNLEMCTSDKQTKRIKYSPHPLPDGLYQPSIILSFGLRSPGGLEHHPWLISNLIVCSGKEDGSMTPSVAWNFTAFIHVEC